jgi:5,6-dimethylbenzimidazole synthase
MFTTDECRAVYRAIFERRDMRHFSGGTVAPEVMQRLLTAAHHAPSVGFMQPWRFIRIASTSLRTQLHALVEEERVQTARALGEREDAFMKLKVEGVLEAAEVWVVALAANGFGFCCVRHSKLMVGCACRRFGCGLGVDVRTQCCGQFAANA